VTFRPKSGNHAIVEVVFGLVLRRPFTPTEMEALALAHDRWKDQLPRLGRTAVLQVLLGEQPASTVQSIQPVSGVSFERIKPDGNVEWRLRADERRFVVNCLNYESWSTIWPRARGYLADACQIALGSDNSITGLLLQYIDVFEWTSNPANYRLDALLSRGSPFVPESLWDKGPRWHLHEGWYRQDNLPVAGRLLERLHINGVLDNLGRPTVKMDAYLALELEKAQSSATFFGNSAPEIDRLFDELHDLQKGLMRGYLTKEMAQRIGLNA